MLQLWRVRKDVFGYISYIFNVGVLLTNSKIINEGISNSIIEYMALAKPVIATNGGGTNEIVIDGWNGFLIDYGSADQLIEKINILYSNRQLANDIGINGQKIIKDKFNIVNMSQQYISLCRKLLVSAKTSN